MPLLGEQRLGILDCSVCLWIERLDQLVRFVDGTAKRLVLWDFHVHHTPNLVELGDRLIRPCFALAPSLMFLSRVDDRNRGRIVVVGNHDLDRGQGPLFPKSFEVLRLSLLSFAKDEGHLPRILERRTSPEAATGTSATILADQNCISARYGIAPYRPARYPFSRASSFRGR